MNQRAQEVDLVFQPHTFNISLRIDDNKYVLCLMGKRHLVYVVLFPDETNAAAFHHSVENDVNLDIVCSSDWLTPELLRQVNSPEMPRLPHLPYLKPHTSLRHVTKSRPLAI